MAAARPPKLGQHFLADAGFQSRVAEALDVCPTDLLIEVGAGRGAMTGRLAARARSVVAVEVDPSLAARLRRDFADNTRVEVLQADILAVDLRALCRQRAADTCLVFGNLPYYITSPILHHLFRFASVVRGMALVMQHEVALRVTAAPGCRDYGYLSVLARLYSKPGLSFTIPPGAFAPPPKVRSALVTFEMTPRFPDWPTSEEMKFLRFVELCFAQKRKNLRNNLAGVYGRARVERTLALLELAPNLRAEQLGIGHFRDLYMALSNRT